ncbi:organic cation transporter protein-like [Haliotis asinina]|uniref:organic cation transporter protein-like n=1 Tax=Haliotis asinina TaxID=109174 RepID=UPI0035327C51
MHVEEIIEEIWTFGRFQKIMLVTVLGPRGLLGWSMLVMSFTGTIPDWWCIPGSEGGNHSHHVNVSFDNTTFHKCYTDDDNATCIRKYSDTYNTIVNEWDLVCKRKWITPIITSIQMGGVFFGALAGGQSAEMFGRRKSHFVFMLIHAIANVVAGFSVSWQMFAIIRFILGIAVGALLVVSFTYYMEFIGKKWRSLCSGMPFWSVGVCLFALTAWLTPDWSNLHIICGVIHIPFLCGWFYTPESIRWLAVKNRLEEAEAVVLKVCQYNKRPKPEHTLGILKLVADEERRLALDKKYTYIDIYRGVKMCRMSLLIQFQWACLALIYYGILFGVDALSGNLCLNIFLLSAVDIPADIATLYLNNRFGRKYTCLGYLVLGLFGALSVIIASRHAPPETRGVIITTLALVAKVGVGSGWTAFQVLSSESYPTVIRNLGYGAAGMSSRIGAIIAPFIFTLGGKGVLMPFIVVSVTMAICILVAALLRETKDAPLEDTITSNPANRKLMDQEELEKL